MGVWIFAVSLTAAAAEPSVPMSFPVAASDDVTVVPAGEHGLVLYVQRGGAKQQREILGYDASFEPTWSTSIELPKRYTQIANDCDGDSAWVLLQRDTSHIGVLKTDLRTGETREIEVPLARKGVIRSQLRADGAGGAWVAANNKRHGNLAWISPAGAVSPIEVDRNVHVHDLVEAEGGVVATLGPSRPRPNAALELWTLEGGARAGVREVQGTGNERLLSGQTVTVGDRTLIVGTYQPPALIAGAQGMYVATFDGDHQTGLVLHPFHEFEGFWDWLPEGRQERSEKRAERKKALGDPARLRLALLVTDAVEIEGGTALVAEAYHPVYATHTVTQTVSNGQGGTTTTTTTQTVFVGWQFTHALVAAFDPGGKRLWDHSVPLDRRLTRVISPHVRLLASGSDLALVYPYEKKLHRAEIRDGELVEPDGPISTADVGRQEALKNLEGDAAWWFGDSFLAWGTDRVRGEDDKKGRAFWFVRMDGLAPPPEPEQIAAP